MALQNYLFTSTAAFDSIKQFENNSTFKKMNVVMEKDISFDPPKFESEKCNCQICFLDCAFQVRITLPALT